MRSLTLALLLALPAAGAAQAAAAAAPAGSAAVTAVRDNWRQVTDYVTRAAEEMPEADYAFRPVETVRTFGQLVGHIAGAQHMMCAAALGEPIPAEDAVERAAQSKEALVKALRESSEHCARAYAQSDAGVAAGTQLFGQRMTRLHALTLNAVHNGEHYGNIVTYMRMKGMVPPSSRQQ
jgi:uncharacterized damage-inducible protein DinB